MDTIWTIMPIIILLFIITEWNRRKRRRLAVKRRKNKKKGVKRVMPINMIKPYIGKKVTMMLAGEIAGFECIILELEDNWVKVDEKKNIRIINGDIINYISIAKPKDIRG